MSTYRDQLRIVNRHAGRAADSTWEYIGDRGKPDGYYRLPWQQQQRLEQELEEINSNLDRRPIAAEVLAVKADAARHGELGPLEDQLIERPEIHELLWWLQYWSFQEGGLAQHVVAPLLEQERQRLGFPELWSIKPANKGRFTEAQIRTLLDAAPGRVLSCFDLDAHEFIADIAYFNRDRLATPDAWIDQMRTEISVRLPLYLHQLCQSPAVDFSGKQFTFIPDIIGRLIELMNARAAIERHSIAHTETFRRIAEEVGFAQSQRGMVMIVGDSRLGKTVSAKALVHMRPGRRRHFEVPSTNDLAGLYREMANRCLGVSAAPGVKPEALRYLVEYVLRVSRMAVIADEFHHCLPVQYTRRTKPRRLDWIRTALFDRGVPIIAITTPQDMANWQRFMDYTQYAQNQFRGRLDLEVQLSSEISSEDVAAVARHVLKGCSEDAIDLVISRADRCELPFKAVDAIHRRAAWWARNESRSEISDADLDAAWKELEPTYQYTASTAGRPARAPVSEPAQAVETAPAEPIQAPRISRGTTLAPVGRSPRASIIPEMAGA